MAKGYAEGPAAEEAERRREELARGRAGVQRRAARLAVFGSTGENEASHFLGWRDELDPDELFASGRAWGLSVRKISS